MSTVRNGRGLFYHRDSGGKAEMTPAQYVQWARREAGEEISFDGTPERIDAMIREGRSADGDLFLDYDVKGNLLSRPGLDALFREALGDPRVTHIFIPRRDRLARPDDPIDGVKMETRLRAAGKTLVFMKMTLPPLRKGQKADIAETITAVVDYDRSDEERIDLAQKILDAQIRLAKLGYSTGGRPPYGFRRWLAKDDGTLVRELAEGERVRMAGHHVVWLPTAETELKIIRRILQLLETMPACQVAALLTAEGIPSPAHGRWRKDRGIKHPVSGVWHQTTVVSIARNPLLVAVATYGLRSMGDKLRFTPSLHFLKKCAACASLHRRNQWSAEFPVSRQFAHSEREFASLGFCPQRLTSLVLLIDRASNALFTGETQRFLDARNPNGLTTRLNLGRLGIFSESAGLQDRGL